jgi:Uma2 family endonuclease
MAVHVDPDLPVRPLSVADVDAMVRAGILGEDDRVELLEGALVEISPQSEAHSYAMRRLIALAAPAAAVVGLEVLAQGPLALPSAISRPEPDLAIAPPAPRDRHPSGALLVVEISVSSRRIDLGLKAAIYASAGVPEYWVLDVEARTLVVHREPEPGRYSKLERFGDDADVTAVAVGLIVPVAALL